jgi:hypothetical protein
LEGNRIIESLNSIILTTDCLKICSHEKFPSKKVRNIEETIIYSNRGLLDYDAV